MLLHIHEPDVCPDPALEGCVLGIDLGTTHTVAAHVTQGQIKVLPLDSLRTLVPSVVAFSEGVYIVGQRATEILQENPQKAVSSIKRLMGRSREHLHELPAQYTLDPQSQEVRVRLGEASLKPSEVSAQILSFIKKASENILGQRITRAVITVPAYFDDAARHATREAARLAGLHVLRLLNEPTAAALAYGLDRELDGYYVIYDLGGGTFDLSILKLTQGVFQVLATGGNTALGGDDFDHALLKYWQNQIGIPELHEAEQRQYLPWVRQAKQALSSQENVTCTLSWAHEAHMTSRTTHTCDRATFEALIQPYVLKTLHVCRHVLRDSGLAVDDIQGLVLVGGATRTPYVRASVAEFFKCPIHDDINPDEAVAIGAALHASSLTEGGQALLLDVTPLSLGVETVGKLVDVVIHRNTPTPMRQSQWYTTYKDNQEALAIHVVQGESEYVTACRSLGRFELHGIPPMRAGEPRIQVVFDVDADGLLTVTAREQHTGQAQTVHMRPYDGLSFDSVVDLLQKGSEPQTH